MVCTYMPTSLVLNTFFIVYFLLKEAYLADILTKDESDFIRAVLLAVNPKVKLQKGTNS